MLYLVIDVLRFDDSIILLINFINVFDSTETPSLSAKWDAFRSQCIIGLLYVGCSSHYSHLLLFVFILLSIRIVLGMSS